MNEKNNSPINVEQVVSFLTYAFTKAQTRATNNGVARDNNKGTKLYNYQVEFSYLIDDIQRGPVYIVPMRIQEANELVARLEREKGN